MVKERLLAELGGLYPFAGRSWDRGGLKLHYLDEGKGEPVVMVHGNPTWSFFFRGLVSGLKDSHRVIVPDHMGMGLSDRPGEDGYAYTLQSRVDDLDGLLAHAGVKDGVTLVLHDWGGMIGLAWALRRPQAVKRIVLFNTAGFLAPPGKGLPLSLRLARSPLGAFLVRGLNLFSLGAVAFCARRAPLPKPVARGYLAPYATWEDRLAVLRFVEDIPVAPGDPSYDLVRSVSDGLHRLSAIPTLVVWGGRDFVFDGEFLAEWKRRLPGAEYHLLPEAGHFVLEDAPEQALSLVRAFLARRPLGTRA